MEAPCIPQSADGGQIAVETVSCDLKIPDHAIRRFARFLLPRLQADMERQIKSDESTPG